MVRKFELAAQKAGNQFSVGAGLRADDIAAVPGLPNSVAVVRANPNISPRTVDTTIYDNGVARPKVGAAGNSLAFGLYGSRLYGYENGLSSFDLTTLLLVPDGLERTNYQGGVIVGNCTIQYANGLLYTNNGRVVDPEQRQQVGQFPNLGYGTPTCIDPAVGRAFVLNNGQLQVFDLRTFGQLGAFRCRGFAAESGEIVRWGTDGLAFNTTEGQVFLIRSALVGPRRAPVDLVVTRSSFPPALKAGQSASYKLTVTNAGTAPATDVFLTDDISKDLNVLNVKASDGSATAADGVVRADLGDLAVGKSATVDVEVQPAKEGAYAPLAIVRANEVDLNPSDNASFVHSRAAGQPAAPSSGIDLTGTWKSAGQTIEGAGVDLQATLEGVFEVRNGGTAPAPATKLRFYLSYTIGPFLEEELIQEVDVPALAPGKTFEARVKANLAKGRLAEGDVLTAFVDATNLVSESNKDNNRVHSKPIP